jgi:hypothetical protein
MAIDESKLNAFMGNFVHDLGAVMHAATIVVGDQLGLYKALSGGPLTAEALAKKTGTDARYVREWLSAQAASGYVQFDPATQQFSMTEEQAFALAVEGSPAFIPGAFQIAVAQFKAIPKIAEAFKTGKGVGWHEHDTALFHGTERFFRPGYAANLVGSWIPALDGVEKKLKAGARIADVGCGHGASTLIMARPIRNRSSSASTTTSLPSATRAKPQGRPASRSGCTSKPSTRRNFRGPITTWLPSSTACTTWETRSAPRRTCGRACARTAPG